MSEPTLSVDLAGIGEVIICPDVDAPNHFARGGIAVTHREFDALEAAAEEKLGSPKLVRAVALVKKTFLGAMINRILTVEESVLDRETAGGILAGNPRRQVAPPPAVKVLVPRPCPVCGGLVSPAPALQGDLAPQNRHLDGCMMEV